MFVAVLAFIYETILNLEVALIAPFPILTLLDHYL